MVSTDDNTKTAAEDGSDSREMMDHMAEGNTQMSTKTNTDKLGANLETDNDNPASVDYSCAVTADDIVSKSHINLNKPAQERLYTVVLPKDLLLRGFSFAKQTPSPPEPEQPPSKKQIAHAQWQEKEAKTAQLTKDELNRVAAKKREKEGRKQKKRIAKGANHKPMCADYQILDKRRKAAKKGKKVLDHAATSEACQARSGCRRIDTQEPEATKTADGCQTITLDTVTEVPKKQSENNLKETQMEIKGAFHKDDTVVKEATHFLPQEADIPVIDARELNLDEPPHLGLLFGEADEGDEAVEKNSSAPESVTKPDENEGLSTMCKDTDDAAA
ncbi:uncharacterized protein LY79DRAFT_674416 [Colletotrichum navitas]|uniref:Uncharacterized protein n=1 Tax=Colletotrichum navitas TaxID=681940 RepID=A0AAD8PM07_9PEZI|nr:uncharacterized protein LY79DRAFT_674416 [Colletotrichum navitas]KAK1569814.1 hypothetical protein LY79DRAFT_674416 [Colletotrichum navitas]